jgi:hypothetical protein
MKQKNKKNNMANNNNKKSEAIENWRNENGDPDFAYLQSLAKDTNPEALEKLRSIAEDLDVDFDTDTSAEDLGERIRSAVGENEDAEPDATN